MNVTRPFSHVPKRFLKESPRGKRLCKEFTIEVPADLTVRATTVGGEGVTPTARRGFELITVRGAYGHLRRFRGKVKFSIKLSELRLD